VIILKAMCKGRFILILNFTAHNFNFIQHKFTHQLIMKTILNLSY